MTTSPEFTALEVNALTLNDWLDGQQAVLVDVRETSEYEQEHIPGSVLVPLSVFDPERFPRITGKKLVFHCAVGKRSAAAAKQLMKEGHPQVYNLTGGINAWKEAGLVTEIQFIPPAVPQDLPISAKDRQKLETAMTGVSGCDEEWRRLHPGAVLLKEFLQPLGISRRRLAEDINVSPRRIGDLVRCKTAVNLDIALRLARYFNTAEDFWLRAQIEYDLDRAQDPLLKVIHREIAPHKPISTP